MLNQSPGAKTTRVSSSGRAGKVFQPSTPRTPSNHGKAICEQISPWTSYSKELAYLCRCCTPGPQPHQRAAGLVAALEVTLAGHAARDARTCRKWLRTATHGRIRFAGTLVFSQDNFIVRECSVGVGANSARDRTGPNRTRSVTIPPYSAGHGVLQMARAVHPHPAVGLALDSSALW